MIKNFLSFSYSFHLKELFESCSYLCLFKYVEKVHRVQLIYFTALFLKTENPMNECVIFMANALKALYTASPNHTSTF